MLRWYSKLFLSVSYSRCHNCIRDCIYQQTQMSPTQDRRRGTRRPPGPQRDLMLKTQPSTATTFFKGMSVILMVPKSPTAHTLTIRFIRSAINSIPHTDMQPGQRDQYFIDLMKARVEETKNFRPNQLHKSVITDVCGALNTPLGPEAGGKFESRWKL
jgi:hypothetical protein